MSYIRNRILAWARARKPDFVIGGADNPYLRRHWLLPRNRLLNVYVHEFLRSDEDRALHDHPWIANCSWLIDGEYYEHTIAAGGVHQRAHRRAGDWKLRLGPAPHRVELVEVVVDGTVGYVLPCWTVFITGPVVRTWGFHCAERGWVPWRKFVDERDTGAVGKGCDA